MLASAVRAKNRQDALVETALTSARRSWRNGTRSRFVTTLAAMQVRAARDAETALVEALAEQSIDAPALTAIAPQAFTTASDGRTLGGLLRQAETLASLEAMVTTQLTDTGRAATNVALTVRPNVSGYIRNVGATCCSRCAILAGRFYRYSAGFKRHTNCRCTMVATDSDAYIDTPDDLFRQGRITDLSVADRKSVEQGADMSQVVNVRRSSAGLTVAGSVLERGGRLTPAGIQRLASDRKDAVRLLAKHGYLL